MSPHDAIQLQGIVEKDAMFLRDHSIMDYSLFITIERVSAEEHASIGSLSSDMLSASDESDNNDTGSFGSINERPTCYHQRNRIAS